MNFSEVLDNISHSQLLNILKSVVIVGKPFNLLKSYSSNRIEPGRI